MADYQIKSFAELEKQFSHLPGIGFKSAERLAYYILSLSDDEVRTFTQSIQTAHDSIHTCKICCNLTDQEICPICASAVRDHALICVVENPRDVLAIERTCEYNGTYHVLHGAISPANHVGPDQLRIKELLARMKDNSVEEVIMATNATVEGEATAMYISRLLKQLGVKTTRLAYGIPVGGDLEYADKVTLSLALEGRSEL